MLHVASHHLSPGKKQWTWGNGNFGRAWDRNLTDPASAFVSGGFLAGTDPASAFVPGGFPAGTSIRPGFRPYIELMAGVYTENQPDFTWLMPYEEKQFTQYFMPYREIGIVKQASKDFVEQTATLAPEEVFAKTVDVKGTDMGQLMLDHSPTSPPCGETWHWHVSTSRTGRRKHSNVWSAPSASSRPMLAYQRPKVKTPSCFAFYTVVLMLFFADC